MEAERARSVSRSAGSFGSSCWPRASGLPAVPGLNNPRQSSIVKTRSPPKPRLTEKPSRSLAQAISQVVRILKGPAQRPSSSREFRGRSSQRATWLMRVEVPTNSSSATAQLGVSLRLARDRPWATTNTSIPQHTVTLNTGARKLDPSVRDITATTWARGISLRSTPIAQYAPWAVAPRDLQKKNGCARTLQGIATHASSPIPIRRSSAAAYSKRMRSILS